MLDLLRQHSGSRLAVTASLVVSVLAAHANVTLPPVFGDGVVLQREQPIPVWGWAAPGESVRVSLGATAKAVRADPQGAWAVTLPPRAATANAGELVVRAENTVVCRNVAVGDVWWCTGQSNMEFTVVGTEHGADEIGAARYPLIRQIKIAHSLAATPQEKLQASLWTTAEPETVARFTAVGYFFAKRVQQATGVPIGLVNCSWSGTSIEPWMPAETLAQPQFAAVRARWRADLAAYPERRVAYEQAVVTWGQQNAAAAAKGAEALALFLGAHRRPRPPAGAPDHPYPSNPSALFNGMVHPLRRLPIKGVLWYQGEANAVRAGEYAALFQATIRSWRDVFRQSELPFYWVQIAAFEVATDWPGLREAQAAALTLPHTGQAVAIDIGDPANIHPRNKQEVGRRLALLALHRTYGLPLEDSGPEVVTAVREHAAVRMTFAHADGLHARSGRVPSLELAGADGVFHPAEGRVEGVTVTARAAAVAVPVAVRYAWRAAPDVDLFNAAGLPAAPFRVSVR